MSTLDPLVDAELKVLRLLGIAVYPSSRLDGQHPRWCPELSALSVPTDLTPDEAECVACEVLGRMTDNLKPAG